MKENKVNFTILNKHVYMTGYHDALIEVFLNADQVVAHAEKILTLGEEAFGTDAMHLATDKAREEHGKE